MKRIIFISLLCLNVVLVTSLCSQTKPFNKNFGVGLVLGEPTALNLKLFLKNNHALDLALGWSYWGYSSRYYDRYWDYDYDSRCYDPHFYRDHEYYCDNLGYNYYDRGWNIFHLHADYLFHNFNLIKAKETFVLYGGPGINLEFWRGGGAILGVRGEFGIAWMCRKVPIDVFFELAPVLDLYPGPFFDLNGGLGCRWYF
jgi:hypothetical protein